MSPGHGACVEGQLTRFSYSRTMFLTLEQERNTPAMTMDAHPEIDHGTKVRHEFAIKADDDGSVPAQTLMYLLAVAEGEYRKRNGIFDSEPVPFGVVSVSFKNGTFAASFEVAG